MIASSGLCGTSGGAVKGLGIPHAPILSRISLAVVSAGNCSWSLYPKEIACVMACREPVATRQFVKLSVGSVVTLKLHL